MNFTPFPTLSTERLILRQIENEDEREVYRLRCDDRIMKHIGRPTAKSLEDARNLISNITKELEDNKGITWAITLKNDSRLIGTIGFWKIIIEHLRGEIGYLLDYDYQGKGIMQEALGKVLNYAFKIMDLHSIEANVNPDNLSSIRLLEKNDFIREGYLKENYYFNGRFFDTALYSLLNPFKNK